MLVARRHSRPMRTVSVLEHDGRMLGLHDLHWVLPGEVARTPEKAIATE